MLNDWVVFFFINIGARAKLIQHSERGTMAVLVVRFYT